MKIFLLTPIGSLWTPNGSLSTLTECRLTLTRSLLTLTGSLLRTLVITRPTMFLASCGFRSTPVLAPTHPHTDAHAHAHTQTHTQEHSLLLRREDLRIENEERAEAAQSEWE
jgi:hypothetical protein